MSRNKTRIRLPTRVRSTTNSKPPVRLLNSAKKNRSTLGLAFQFSHHQRSDFGGGKGTVRLGVRYGKFGWISELIIGTVSCIIYGPFVVEEPNEERTTWLFYYVGSWTSPSIGITSERPN